MYQLRINKKQIPRFVRICDPAAAMKYECPVSLSPVYQPISIKGSDPKHTFTGPIIDEYTKTCKLDPLSENPLDAEWRIEDFSLDAEMSKVKATIPLVNGGMLSNNV